MGYMTASKPGVLAVLLLAGGLPPAAMADTLNLFMITTHDHVYTYDDVTPPYPGHGPFVGYDQSDLDTLVQRKCAAQAPSAPAPKHGAHPVKTPPCREQETQAVEKLVISIRQKKVTRDQLDQDMYYFKVVSLPMPPMGVIIPPKKVYTDDDRAAMCRIADYNYHRMANMLFAEVNAWKNGAKGIDLFNSSWLAALEDLYPEQAGLFAMQELMLKDPHDTTGDQLHAAYESTWRQIIGMPDDSYCQKNQIQGI